MKTADNSKLFLKIFERTYDGLYICIEKSALIGRICGFCEISFKCSINQLLQYRDLTKVIAARILTNFTFVLKRISEQKFVMNFCYTELLFTRHFGSDRTLISSRTSCSECLEKFFLEIIRRKFPGRQTQQLQI